MRPYYQDDLVTLYHGDALEIDAWLQADALVIDPPYGRSWKQGQWKGLRGKRRDTSDAHAGIANDESTLVRDTILEAFGSDRRVACFGDLMLDNPLGTRQVLIYAKPNDAGGRGAIGGFRRDAEAIYLIGPWPSGMGGISSVLRSNVSMLGGSEGLAGRYQHPHAKPQDILEQLISRSEGRLIGDPTAGSCSTLVAAKALGIPTVGVELEERYCEIGAKRLSQEVLDFGDGAA